MTATRKPSPIIGLLGGIASGKSFYTRLFASRGCLVIDADRLVADLYKSAEVLTIFADWWGRDVLNADGSLNRATIAKIIFTDPAQRQRLESYVHPKVRAQRDAETAAARASANPPPAIIWDIPLLVEINQHALCDLLLFIDTPREVREWRAAQRGWPQGELARRESQQAPLEAKRALSHQTLSGTATEPQALALVDGILAKLS